MFTKLNLECWYEIPVIAIERGENNFLPATICNCFSVFFIGNSMWPNTDDYDLIRVAGP